MSFINNIVYMLPWSYVAGGAAAAAFIILFKIYAETRSQKNNIPLPPGPPAVRFWEDPMPKQKVAAGIAKLIEEHGPVISFQRGSQVTIVVGRMDAATEILEKQGAALVDRPRSVAVGEILSGRMHLVLQPAGDRLRRMRRAAYSHLQPKVAMMYEEIYGGQSALLFGAMFEGWRNHLRGQRNHLRGTAQSFEGVAHTFER